MLHMSCSDFWVCQEIRNQLKSTSTSFPTFPLINLLLRPGNFSFSCVIESTKYWKLNDKTTTFNVQYIIYINNIWPNPWMNVLTGISCFRRRHAALRRGDALWVSEWLSPAPPAQGQNTDELNQHNEELGKHRTLNTFKWKKRFP